jgi:hypothetical protein
MAPLKNIEEVVDEMYTEIYVGKDKNNPSITTRMALVESLIDKLSKNLNKALYLAVGALITVIGEAILRSITK